MNNEQAIMSVILPRFGYTDCKLHSQVSEVKEMDRDEIIYAIKQLQKARMIHRKGLSLFKTIRISNEPMRK